LVAAVAELGSLGHSFVEQAMFFIKMVRQAARQMDALCLTNLPIAGSDYWHENGFSVVVCTADWTRHFFRELLKGSRPWPNHALHRTANCAWSFAVRFLFHTSVVGGR